MSGLARTLRPRSVVPTLLAEIGLPHQKIPLALLLFIVGVELGQIAFVIAILCALLLFRLVCAKLPRVASMRRWQLVPYVIGGLAAFWTIERTISFLS